MDVTHRTEQGISRRPNDASSVTDDGDSSYKWKVLASVVVGLFMVILDATVVNVALRSLQEKYAASTSDVQWIISLYTLALGIATPLSGFLGDRVGVKRVYISGLAIFVLGSVLCGLAPSLPLLIAARGLQGIGGGIALPLGTAMLFGAFPPEQRGAAFGVFGIVLVFAPASGPLLGGWLVDHNLIPWIFFINLPIGLLGLTVSGRFLRGVVSATFDDAAGEPQWSLVGRSMVCVTTRSLTRLKLVTQGSPAASFDLHNLAALRCTSGLGLISAARTLFDAQEHPLLGKIKALEVV